MKFAMPLGQSMEIRCSKEIDEDEIDKDEEVDGVVYNILWNDKLLPWCTTTRSQAYAIALGCQWGAFETFREMTRNGNRKADRI
jgi:hypothetical protein